MVKSGSPPGPRAGSGLRGSAQIRHLCESDDPAERSRGSTPLQGEQRLATGGTRRVDGAPDRGRESPPRSARTARPPTEERPKMSTRTTKKAPAKTSSLAIPTKSRQQGPGRVPRRGRHRPVPQPVQRRVGRRHRWTRCRQGCLRHRHGGLDGRVDRPHRPPRQGRHRVEGGRAPLHQGPGGEGRRQVGLALHPEAPSARRRGPLVRLQVPGWPGVAPGVEAGRASPRFGPATGEPPRIGRTRP